MVEKKTPPVTKLSLRRIMDYVSVFFFSTLALIIGIIIFNSNNNNTYALIFGIIFITGYFYLALELFLFYVTTFSKWMKGLYEKHPLWFKGISILFFIVMLGFGLYKILGWQTLLEIGGSLLLMTLMAALWKIGVQIYKKYKNVDK